MAGSPVVAAFVAHAAFWVLLALAIVKRRGRVAGSVGALWLIGYAASRSIAGLSLFFPPYVAVLDIALVLIVLQRDVRLT